ncbi:hypothetical protein DFH09DRAFT_1068987 [Mycena vulgaris]|nr:hypothetical protein DFH09DRAFT_1068987 [Mycena vulgaris]
MIHLIGCWMSLTSQHITPVNILQAGHSLEKNVYGLSPEPMFSVSEQVLHSCLAVSTDWQKATGLMPSGLSLLYKSATRGHFNTLIIARMIVLPKAKGNSGKAGRASFNDVLLQHFDIFHKTLAQAHLTMYTVLCKTIRAVQALKEELCTLQEEVQWGV